jgi:hypothetical protein
MVDALSAPHMSNDMVHWLTGPATDGMRALQVGTPAPLIFIHDWRVARTYDLKARANLVAWGLSMGAKAVHSITIVLRPDAPAMVKMACHAGVVPFAVAGIKMTVEDDFNAAVARLGVRAR